MSTAALLRLRGLEATLYTSRHHIPYNDLAIVAASGQEMRCAVSNAQDIFFVPIPLCVKHLTHYPKCPLRIWKGFKLHACTQHMNELHLVEDANTTSSCQEGFGLWLNWVSSLESCQKHQKINSMCLVLKVINSVLFCSQTLIITAVTFCTYCNLTWSRMVLSDT